MITNERQLKITKSQAARFEKALANLLTEGASDGRDVPEVLYRAQTAAMASQLTTLREEVAEYEALRDGHFQTFDADALTGLPQILIKARIARGMTQRELADLIGVKEQQIQRYEGTEYASASLRRLQQVVDALRVEVQERVSLVAR